MLGTDAGLSGRGKLMRILFERQMFLASLLSFFESAKLEYTAWIMPGCYGPPSRTVPEEALEV